MQNPENLTATTFIKMIIAGLALSSGKLEMDRYIQIWSGQ